MISWRVLVKTEERVSNFGGGVEISETASIMKSGTSDLIPRDFSEPEYRINSVRFVESRIPRYLDVEHRDRRALKKRAGVAIRHH
jgi:hypothetical protein